MDELYLDNIDEFVNDHNKIVTYKWLSLTLGVHVNTAKQMLYHYLEHKRKESSPQLHATYLVSGKSVDNGQSCHKVSLVREDQLDEFKSKMTLVVSVHVYSVQKAVLRDSGPLYSVDYDAVRDHLKNCNRYSAIRCSSAVPMSSVEQQQAREKETTFVPENTKSAIKEDTSGASKPATKPPKGIMGMFSNKSTSKNQVNSKDIKLEQKEDTPVTDPPKNKLAAKANPMAKFFGNQSKKPDKPTREEQEVQSSIEAEQQQSSQTEEEPEPAAAPQQNHTKTESRSKTKRLEESGSEEERMEKKKRRRIKRPDPDSSDEDVIPDSPQPLETKPTSPKKKVEAAQHSHGPSETKIRKRRRVLKTRTFVDNEGCIVTEKGYESESYSEKEDDVQPTKQSPTDIKAKLLSSSKENEKKNQKKSSASSQKGTKQASIMGFFQKK